MGLIAFAGRALISFLFIASGVQKVATWGEVPGAPGGPALALMRPKLAAFHTLLEKQLAAAGVPFDIPPVEPVYLLMIAVALELCGAVLFLLADAELGAWCLLAFTVAVSPIMHAFWAVKDAQSAEYMNEFIMFMKNVSIAGGLLLYIGLKRQLAAARSKLKRD